MPIMKKNTTLIIIICLLVLLGISAFIAIKYHPNILTATPKKITANQLKNNTAGIILFYGDGCPHCAIVEKYLADNNVAGKVTFDKKEVFNNADNSALLGDKAHGCGLNTDSIGVPFLWDKETGKCFVGDEEVINYFKTKIGQ
jgi:hypothetical protein